MKPWSGSEMHTYTRKLVYAKVYRYSTIMHISYKYHMRVTVVTTLLTIGNFPCFPYLDHTFHSLVAPMSSSPTQN